MELSEYPVAKYTMTFYEFRHRHSKWFDEQFSLGNEEDRNAFITALISLWDMYEIVVVNPELEKLFLVETFDLNKNYFMEKIDNYRKQFNFETGINLTRIKGEEYDESSSLTSNSTSTYSDTDSSSGVTKDLHSELPHKHLDTEDEYFQYPNESDKSASTNETESSGNSTGSNSYNSTREKDKTENETISDPSKYLELKEQYMKQIANWWLKFAEAFTDCFLHIY